MPRLADDIQRSYVVLAVTLVPVLALPFALAAARRDLSIEVLTTSMLLTAWAILALASAVITYLTFRRADGAQLAEWMRATTPTTRWRRIVWEVNGGGAISWAITGSFLAVVAVFLLAFNRGFQSEPLIVYPAVAVVVCSLAMIVVAYAVRYAREDAVNGGAEFAGTERPVFDDYLYLAAQVGTTFSSSDVTLTAPSMRRVVTLHSLVSFAFNTVIIALLVSVLISGAS